MISTNEKIDIKYFDKITFYVEEHPNLKVSVDVYDEEELFFEITLISNLDKEIEVHLIKSDIFRPSFMKKDNELAVYFPYPNFTGTTEETSLVDQNISLQYKVPRSIIHDVQSFHNDTRSDV